MVVDQIDECMNEFIQDFTVHYVSDGDVTLQISLL